MGTSRTREVVLGRGMQEVRIAAYVHGAIKVKDLQPRAWPPNRLAPFQELPGMIYHDTDSCQANTPGTTTILLNKFQLVIHHS